MKIKTLIEALQLLDENDEIYLTTADGFTDDFCIRIETDNKLYIDIWRED